MCKLGLCVGVAGLLDVISEDQRSPLFGGFDSAHIDAGNTMSRPCTYVTGYIVHVPLCTVYTQSIIVEPRVGGPIALSAKIINEASQR
jgi:hypothetical protein